MDRPQLSSLRSLVLQSKHNLELLELEHPQVVRSRELLDATVRLVDDLIQTPAAAIIGAKGGKATAKRMKKKVGKTLKVLVDEISAEGGIGRTAADAPEIDGVVYIAPPTKASKRYKAGDFVSVKITGADGHDLWGEV